MLFGISTYLTAQSRLTTAWLEKAQSAGFARLELFAHRLSLDYRDHGQIEELGQWFRDSSLRPYALHTPPGENIAEPDRMRRRNHCDELKRALEVLELIPCPYVVQHYGAKDDLFHERREDAAFASLEELNMFARDRGAAILLENGASELAAPARLLRFLQITHLSNGVLFDVGHAQIRGDGIEAGFRTLEPRIRAARVHDNDGHMDQHLLPQTGQIDWRLVMRLLRAHDRGELVLGASIRDSGLWANPAQAAHDALSRLMEIRIRNEEEE